MDVHETCYLWCAVTHQNNCLEIKYQGNKSANEQIGKWII